jgi:two-component system nitrogen regulation response regulator GlnG
LSSCLQRIQQREGERARCPGQEGATNLEERVERGLFREDLFHRLNVIRLKLPALRERREDIPLLARYFLLKSARELGVEAKRLSEPAVKFLCAQDLPGNVRQVENLCHWLTVMAPGQTVEVGDLPPELRGEGRNTPDQSWTALLEREVENSLNRGESRIIDGLSASFERTLIKKALAHTGGRRIEAAQLLGLGRNTLTRKIRELGMESDSPAADSADA